MSQMKCPVCGGECISDAEVLVEDAKNYFLPCPDCICIPLDKRLPPPGLTPSDPCPCCGRRFIDDVFSHCHAIMVSEGVIGENTPLGAIGTPLICPGIAMNTPPFLPKDSLILLTRHADRKVAEILVSDVPEVKGIIGDKGVVPGIADDDLSGTSSNELLAGCDVRADIFVSSNGPFVIYKQQSVMHIEFPRAAGPKLRSVESMIMKKKPEVFFDACSGAGTLGIAALMSGTPMVVMNDAWYAAAFWSAVNLNVNRGLLELPESEVFISYEEMKSVMVSLNPVKVAEWQLDGRYVSVLWGDYMNAGDMLPDGKILAAIDIFGKENPGRMDRAISDWKAAFGGEAFIP